MTVETELNSKVRFVTHRIENEASSFLGSITEGCFQLSDVGADEETMRQFGDRATDLLEKMVERAKETLYHYGCFDD